MKDQELEQRARRAAMRTRNAHADMCRVAYPSADEEKLWQDANHKTFVMARYILALQAKEEEAGK